MARGTLFLVVGPSGVGKDSLLDGAREALARDNYVFARRVITRPAEAGGENHHAVSPAGFAARRDGGAFALSWRANGLDYAIPAEIDAELAQGRHVVANVSRTIIAEARERYRPLRVICVTAPAAIVARRLAARGRENAEDIAARLARGGALALPEGPDVAVVANDGSLDAGIARMLAALRAPALA